jgi:hypothetical protein
MMAWNTTEECRIITAAIQLGDRVLFPPGVVFATDLITERAVCVAVRTEFIFMPERRVNSIRRINSNRIFCFLPNETTKVLELPEDAPPFPEWERY